MPTLTGPLRTAAAVAAMAVAANFGIASASARTELPTSRIAHHAKKAHAGKHAKKANVRKTTIAAAGPAGISGSWKLVLDSEFNGPSLPNDCRVGWFGTHVTAPVNSHEDDCYSPSNVTFPGDGTMHLNVTAQSSTCGGVTPSRFRESTGRAPAHLR